MKEADIKFESARARELLDNNQRKKRARIRAVAKDIKTKGRVDTRKYIAQLGLNGVRKTVAEEYIQALIDIEYLHSEQNSLKWIGPDNL